MASDKLGDIWGGGGLEGYKFRADPDLCEKHKYYTNFGRERSELLLRHLTRPLQREVCSE